MTLRQQLLHTARTDRPFRRIEVGRIGQEDCLDQQQHRQGGDSIEDGRDQQLHSKVSVRRDKHSPAAATAFALHSKATRPMGRPPLYTAHCTAMSSIRCRPV